MEILQSGAWKGASCRSTSQDDHGIELVGPSRPIPNWQSKVEGAYTVDRFTVDWQNRVARCPEGARRRGGTIASMMTANVATRFIFQKLHALIATREPYVRKLNKRLGRSLFLPSANTRLCRKHGICWQMMRGTNVMRAFGARRSRYAGLAKNHLQQVATAAAINLDRLAAWFDGRPQAATRTSRFAALAA